MTSTTAVRRETRSVAAQARPLATVLVVTAATGVLLAPLWVLLAPQEVARVRDGGVAEPLAGESEHRFDGLAIFVLLALATGLLLAVAVWTRRELRGPDGLLTAMAGSAAAGVVGVVLGEWLAELRHDETGAVGSLVDIAPEIETWWVLVAMPLTFALTYGTLTACTTSPDLGRGS